MHDHTGSDAKLVPMHPGPLLFFHRGSRCQELLFPFRTLAMPVSSGLRQGAIRAYCAPKATARQASSDAGGAAQDFALPKKPSPWRDGLSRSLIQRNSRPA